MDVPAIDLSDAFPDIDPFALADPDQPVSQVEVPVIDTSPIAPAPARSQKRTLPASLESNTSVVKQTKVTFSASEVEKVLDQLLSSSTGALSRWRPYFAMSDDERRGIAGPFARWATKKAPESPRVAKALTHLDILAGITNLSVYFIRVGIESSQDAARQREARAMARGAKVVDMAGRPVSPWMDNPPAEPSAPTPPAAIPAGTFAPSTPARPV
jgi:hypothetical protein